jgi:serine/threonine protein phosphatase PrpC
MRCPECGLEPLAGNRFCEDCGARLVGLSGPPSAVPEESCPECGAGPGTTDADGFCTRCGHERRGAAGRLEVEAASHLAGVSDPGPHHDRNEDFLALAAEAGGDVLVVCDGVSNSQTPAAAAVAAGAAACEALRRALCDGTPFGTALLKSAIGAAEAAVAAVPFEPGVKQDPPETTLVAAARRGRQVALGWLGDSRAYYVAPGGVRLLTHDHSWLNEVVAAGEMTVAEARRSPLPHAVTRTVGGRRRNPAADEPSLRTFEAPDGPGWLLLCSDGFWNHAAEPDRLADLVRRCAAGDALTLARRLTDFARDCRGRDNITVAVLALSPGRAGERV